MKKLNLTSGLLFAARLVLVAVFAVIFFGLTIAPANAATDGWHIKDDATGGDCSLIGSWDTTSKTCTLSQDLGQGIIIDSDGITLDGASYTVSSDIQASGQGIYIAGKRFITIKNISIQNFNYGVRIDYSNSIVILNISSINNQRGVSFNFSNYITLSDSFIKARSSSYITYGVGAGGDTGNNNNKITHNTITDTNYIGIDVSYAEDTLIENNTLLNNRNWGIIISRGSKNTISNNFISGSYTGIYNNSTAYNKIYYNTIESFRSFRIANDTSNTDGHNIIHNNNFTNGPWEIYRSDDNIFNLPLPIGGNYWSNFDEPSEGCNNTDGDNFCDSPYVFTGGQDNLPWTKKDGWLASQNNPPTLAFPATGPYAGDGIDPNSGDTATEFTFRVIYTDADNDPPSFINTFLFGHATTTIPMSVDAAAESALHDGNYVNGEQYAATGKREVAGTNYYTFRASDGTSEVVFPQMPNVAGFPLEIQQLDPVIIVPGLLGSWDKNGEWVIDPVLHTYDDLIATLEANGYAKDINLFAFPYDWRNSNVSTSVLLHQKIDEIQQICRCTKVDLVAHSMGGLVARQYIQSDQYENDVDQLIFLATPHLGAPKAYLMWEGGGSDIGGEDQFIKFILSKEAKKADYSSLFDYVRNKPITSIQELLPIYDYLRDKDNGIVRTYPNNYPTNSFLENLKNSLNELFTSAVRITNIVGDAGNNTINTVRVVKSPEPPKWEHGYPDGFDGSTSDRGLERGGGDGTVPSNSAEFIENDLNKFLGTEHAELVTRAEGLIFKKLTGKDATILIDKPDIPNFKLLIIKILSPVDVVVIAPDGNKIGKNFATGEEFNEIDGAFYSGFLTDNEYITIPNPLDGEYQIQTQGTGDGGSYTIAVGYITGGSLTEVEFNGETAPNLISDIDLSLYTSNPEDIKFSITIDDVIKDIETAYNIGWIDNQGVKNSLIKKLKGSNGVKAFLNELEAQHNKHINNQIYNLLKEDVEWLRK